MLTKKCILPVNTKDEPGGRGAEVTTSDDDDVTRATEVSR